VNQTARQVGGAIGIAVLVMILDTSSGAADAVGPFRRLWAFAAATALLSGLVGSRIPRTRANAPEAVGAPSELVVEGVEDGQQVVAGDVVGDDGVAHVS